MPGCGVDEGEEVASASFLPRREVDRTRPTPANCISLSWGVSWTASCGVVESGSRCLGPLPPLRVTRLASEKREMEVQLSRSREEALAGRAARQEAEALRRLVQGLELELRQERGLRGRAASRRSQDCRRLAKEVRGESRGGGASLDFGLVWTSALAWSGLRRFPLRFPPQLEEVKASERSLRARLKTLNTELAMYGRG